MQTLELSNQTKDIDLKSYNQIKLKCLEYEDEIPSYTVIYLDGKQTITPLSRPQGEYIINTDRVGKVTINCKHGKCKIQIIPS